MVNKSSVWQNVAPGKEIRRLSTHEWNELNLLPLEADRTSCAKVLLSLAVDDELLEHGHDAVIVPGEVLVCVGGR